MHTLMSCKNCKNYLGGLQAPEHLFLYCSEDCKNEREDRLCQKRQEENARDVKGRKAALAFAYEARMLKDKPIDEETGKVVKINKNGKPRKKRVERKPRVCGRCGGTGHNKRTCNRR